MTATASEGPLDTGVIGIFLSLIAIIVSVLIWVDGRRQRAADIRYKEDMAALAATERWMVLEIRRAEASALGDTEREERYTTELRDMDRALVDEQLLGGEMRIVQKGINSIGPPYPGKDAWYQEQRLGEIMLAQRARVASCKRPLRFVPPIVPPVVIPPNPPS